MTWYVVSQGWPASGRNGVNMYCRPSSGTSSKVALCEREREREGVRDISRKRKRQRQREKEESECKVPQASVVIILILMYNSYVEARIKMQVNAAYA